MNEQDKNISSKRGFTLIELLVVIAIIGILSSFLLVNFVGIRQRARDSRRKSDIRQIQAALELYRSDVGTYPVPASGSILGTCGSGSSLKDPGNTVTYLQTIPCDPLYSSGSYWNGGLYGYAVGAGNLTYTLGACLENVNDPEGGSNPATNPGGPLASGCSGTTDYYIVVNP